MAMDSNMPYSRINVQENNNDTVWNGAAWGAGAGLGATGLTYGATTFGARGVDALASKAAGNKITRMYTRNQKRMDAGKSYLTPHGLNSKMEGIISNQVGVHNAMGRVQGIGDSLFGSKRRAIATTATGLMGGMLAGAAVKDLK